METCAPSQTNAAVNLLVRGYEAERKLYLLVRNLTLSQKRSLCERHDLRRFFRFLEEKEAVLQMIGLIDSSLEKAKRVVMAHHPPPCAQRIKLAVLLARLTRIIEDIRLMESQNASMLESVPSAC